MQRIGWFIALIAALWLFAMPTGLAQPTTQPDGGPSNWATGCPGCGRECCRGGRGMGRGMPASEMGCRGCGPGCCREGRGYWGRQSIPPSQTRPVPESLETVTGEVMGVDTVTSMNQRSAGVQLRLKTDRGLISVHLGPAWYLEHQELQIKPGDLLEVQGVGWLSDDPPTLMATEVRKGDQVLVLRDTAGIPLWKGWRKLASTSLTLAVPQTVATANLQAGVGIFNRSCVACHAGGGNLVIPEKTLRQQDLQRYQRNSVDAIATQVRHGKNIMPAFQGKLTDQQIQDVTAYVLQQARQGWH